MIIFSDFCFFKTIGYRVANLLSLRNIFGYYARNIIVYVSEYLKLFIYCTYYIICDSNCCIPCNWCYRSAKNQCAANNSTKENEIIDKCDSTSVVGKNGWVVKAIGKHICAYDSLTRAIIPVRIYKPAYFRIVVPRLEIVQTCLGIVEVAPIPQRVHFCEVTRRSEQFAPCVVGVCGSFSAGCGYDLENITLKVLDVEVFCVSAVRGSGEAYHIACAVIVEVKGVCVGNVRSKLAALPDVAVSYAVDGLACAQTGLVIGKAKRIAAFGHGGQLSAALPAHSPAAVAQRVAYTVIAYGLAVVCGQQVAPFSIAVGVGGSRSAAADCAAARAGVLCAAEDIAAVVVSIVPRLSRRRILFPYQLAEIVILIYYGLSTRDRCYVSTSVVGVGGMLFYSFSAILCSFTVIL